MKYSALIMVILFFLGMPGVRAQEVSKKSDLCACTEVYREAVVSPGVQLGGGCPYQVVNPSYHKIEIVTKKLSWPVFPAPPEVCSNAFVKRVKHANEELTKSHYPTYEIDYFTR